MGSVVDQKNKYFFESGEADEWFKRNIKALEGKKCLSNEAVKYIQRTFPKIEAKVGYGDDIPFFQKFDLVHLGFFLYLVDRENYLRCISEADRLAKFGGFLSIIDFETPFPYSNSYSHQSGDFSHKQNNSDIFVASGLYSVVNKFQFSHSNFFFDKG